MVEFWWGERGYTSVGAGYEVGLVLRHAYGDFLGKVGGVVGVLSMPKLSDWIRKRGYCSS